MKRTASVNASSNSSSASRSPDKVIACVMCIDNTGYLASLDVGKVYRVLDAAGRAPAGWSRVIDESGEGYLYPSARFVELNIPPKARRALQPAQTRAKKLAGVG